MAATLKPGSIKSGEDEWGYRFRTATPPTLVPIPLVDSLLRWDIPSSLSLSLSVSKFKKISDAKENYETTIPFCVGIFALIASTFAGFHGASFPLIFIGGAIGVASLIYAAYGYVHNERREHADEILDAEGECLESQEKLTEAYAALNQRVIPSEDSVIRIKRVNNLKEQLQKKERLLVAAKGKGSALNPREISKLESERRDLLKNIAQKMKSWDRISAKEQELQRLFAQDPSSDKIAPLTEEFNRLLETVATLIKTDTWQTELADLRPREGLTALERRDRIITETRAWKKDWMDALEKLIKRQDLHSLIDAELLSTIDEPYQGYKDACLTEITAYNDYIYETSHVLECQLEVSKQEKKYLKIISELYPFSFTSLALRKVRKRIAKTKELLTLAKKIFDHNVRMKKDISDFIDAHKELFKGRLSSDDMSQRYLYLVDKERTLARSEYEHAEQMAQWTELIHSEKTKRELRHVSKRFVESKRQIAETKELVHICLVKVIKNHKGLRDYKKRLYRRPRISDKKGLKIAARIINQRYRFYLSCDKLLKAHESFLTLYYEASRDKLQKTLSQLGCEMPLMSQRALQDRLRECMNNLHKNIEELENSARQGPISKVYHGLYEYFDKDPQLPSPKKAALEQQAATFRSFALENMTFEEATWRLTHSRTR